MADRQTVLDEALNTAVRVVQDALGAQSGDCAGVFFDGTPQGAEFKEILAAYYDEEAADVATIAEILAEEG